MTTITRRHMALALLGASTALAFVAMPYALTLTGLAPAGAFAQSDGEGSDGGDSGGNDGSGDSGGSDGSGGDSPDGGSGGSDGGDSGGNGSGGDTGGSDGGDSGGNDSGGEVVSPTNGANIEVEHADGTREEIENGRYEMQDANGRTIVERPATDADLARLKDLAG